MSRKLKKTCASCKHIASVEFLSGRSQHFCTAKHGQEYGMKIRKNDRACRIHNEVETIPEFLRVSQ